MIRPRSTAVTFAVLAALLFVFPAAASASGDAVRIDPGGSPQQALDYWTKARMRTARPVPVPLAGPAGPAGPPRDEGGPPSFVPPAAPGSGEHAELLSGAVATAGRGSGVATAVADPAKPKLRAHGKVFYTVGGRDYVCSGTAVNSRNKSVVLTAGHCVWDFDGKGGKSRKFIFVPAYRDGEEPFGAWAAKSLATTRKWKRKGNLRYDIGAAVVRRNADGRRLQQIVGARGIGFDQSRRLTYTAFGYPRLDPFDGTTEHRCKSPSEGSDVPGGTGPPTIRIACDMTGGASGGGWIARGKTLVSLTSYSYDSQPGFLYGPYLSSTAKALYKKVRGK